ncbi:MAG: hypothetical protein EHM79_02860 [Geobacter sp.]|nr:MAG: hypothetical protein EHM79_02860 [Geobacter sp.]
MSFILDALKKLEQEKAARKGGAINISDEIVRDKRQVIRKARRTVPVSIVLVALGLLLGATGAYLWYQHGVGDQAKVIAPSSERPLSAAPKMSAASQGTSFTEPAVLQGLPEAAVVPDSSPLPLETKRQTRSDRPEGQNPSKQVFPARATQPDVEASSTGELTRLTVSGIAWQDAPSARRAVINGDLVKEGAQVSGATVEEILPTRVRFSSGGRQFTVSISGPLVAK